MKPLLETDVPPVARPGLDAWAQMTITEARLVWRDTASFILPLALPLLLLIMNGIGAEDAPTAELGGHTPFETFVVPVTIVMVIAIIGLVNMPESLVPYRKSGVLRRLSATPAHPAMVLVAHMLVSLAQTLVGIVLALVVARAAFGMAWPTRPAAALAALVLTCAAMYAAGMLIAALAPTTNTALSIGLVALLVMMALGGVFGGPQNLPDWLATVGGHLPFGAAVETLSAAWTGEALDTGRLAVLGSVTVVASFAATRWFRWQ